MSVNELAHEFGAIPRVLQELIEEHMPLGNAVYLVGEDAEVVKDVTLIATNYPHSRDSTPLILNQWQMKKAHNSRGRYHKIVVPMSSAQRNFHSFEIIREHSEDTLLVISHLYVGYTLSIANEC